MSADEIGQYAKGWAGAAQSMTGGLGLGGAVRVPEPVLTLSEASEAIGRLTQTCESLRADLVSLEDRFVKTDKILSNTVHWLANRKTMVKRVKAWLREKLAE